MSNLPPWLATSPASQFVAACWAIFFVYWFVAAFRVKRTVERSGGLWWRIVTIALLLLFFMRPGGAVSWVGGSRVIIPPSAVMHVLACIVVAIGLVIAVWARTVIGRNWSGLVVFKEGHELVQRGPYHYVRHPIYSGLLLMVLGTALLKGRVDGFVVFAAVFIGLLIKSRMEERLMTRHFPDAYPAYRGRVKGLIPFVI